MRRILPEVMLAAALSLAVSPAAFADKAADMAADDASIAAVQGASIKILSPADGAHLVAGADNTLSYEVTPGKGGDHFHVWVDGKRGPGIHNNQGTYTLPTLAPGEHVIYLAIVDKGHNTTGPKKTIWVTADPK